jgi:hypothetical protein
MTNHVARLYALAISLIVFFAVWLAVSTHPWPQTAKTSSAAVDPQLARLQARERHLRAETRRVNLIVKRRYSAYRKALAHRNHANAVVRAHHNAQLAAAHQAALAASRAASAPVYASSAGAPATVRVVTLPPVAATRTS